MELWMSAVLQTYCSHYCGSSAQYIYGRLIKVFLNPEHNSAAAIHCKLKLKICN